MSIRRTILTAAALAALVAAVLPATSSASTCVPSGAKVLDANKSVVVYKKGKAVKGCYLKTGKTTGLNGSDALRIAGSMVAYTYANDFPGPAGTDAGSAVNVWDLKTGKLVTGFQRDKEDDDLNYTTGDLELSKSGTVALTDEDGASNDRRVVQAKKGAAAFTTLDTGKDIVLDSLAISGKHVFWLNGATPKVATLA